MKIAFVVTSLAKKGPVIVIRDIISWIPTDWEITVYYFDKYIEIEFPVSVKLVRVPKFYYRVDLSQYDVVHSHLLRADLFCFWNRKSIHKSISTMHSDVIRELGISHGVVIGRTFGFLWSQILRLTDKVVFLTNNQRGKYPFIENCRVIYNGRPKVSDTLSIDNILSDIKRSNKNKIILGACAYVVRRKGFTQVIDFLCTVLGEKYIFALVGDGPDIDRLKLYAEQRSVSSRCLFLGRTDNVNRYLPLFDIFVMTSYSEGMPLSLLEAASHKLPIVCSNLPVVEEIFDDEEIVFYELDNVFSLSNAIEIARNSHNQLSNNVYQKFETYYTDKAMSLNYQSLYLECVDNAR